MSSFLQTSEHSKQPETKTMNRKKRQKEPSRQYYTYQLSRRGSHESCQVGQTTNTPLSAYLHLPDLPIIDQLVGKIDC